MSSPLPPPPLLSYALANIIQATTKRAEEGQALFAPITAIWDDYLQSDTVRQLPARLRKLLEILCKEISQTATIHFDSYIKGTRPTKPTNQPRIIPALDGHTVPTANPVPTPKEPRTSVPPTYAQMATSTPVTTPPAQPTKPKPAPRLVRPRPDTRLFIRISPTHPARKAGSFAILTALREVLGPNSKHLKEAQEVKSGYALCTGSQESLTALETKIPIISSVITDCTIERQPHWITYRFSNIPRTVTTLSGLGQLTISPVTDTILSDAIKFTTGQTVARAVESRLSNASGSYHTTWLVSFEMDAHQPLPRTLRILGTAVYSTVLVFKPKITQCTRCFHWHNVRSCIRPQHCRLCGSTTHSEADHTTYCGTPTPHQCPARCLHCGGPHPADDPSCPLRPAKNPRSKAEKQAILNITKPARKRACLAAGCTERPRNVPEDSSIDDTEMPLPRTPTRSQDQAPSISPTAKRTRFQAHTSPGLSRMSPNRFTALLSNA